MAATTAALILCIWAMVMNVVLVESAHHVAVPAPAADCSTVILNMADCLSYVTAGSTVKTPEGTCCSGLKTMLKTDAQCLCETFKNSDQLGVSLNLTKALALPTACHLSAPSATNCGVNLGTGAAPVQQVAAPAPAPAADCSTVILDMADCLSYFTAGSTVKEPEGTCCSGLKTVLETDAECLCETFMNSAELGVSLNLSKALALPTACHLSAPAAYKCGVNLGTGYAPVQQVAGAADCSIGILDMADCLSYFTAGSTVKEPDGTCCSGLKTVLETDAECLCETFMNSAELGVSLNLSKALALPTACHLSAPAAYNCGVNQTGVAPVNLGTGDAPDASRAGNKSSTTGVIIGSVAGGCVVVALLVFAAIYAFRRKGEASQQGTSPFALWDSTSGSGGVPQLKGARSFSFEELKTYTANFSEINNIGAGGYGMVYRGSLPNGQLVAIKRAQQGSTQGGLEFKTEIELLSRVHHKNVVSLVGFCIEQGEQMLVYEYKVNGTLKDSLSGRSGIRLDWQRRLRIALGAAKGLQYLHDLADPPIIHRDIKSNNILLDQALVAKVADFGLSKPLSDANRTHVTTQVKGTIGYMDPEYYMTQQLTEKSDVYGYGVVLLELITARNPIEQGKYIVREVKQVMNKSKELYNLHELLDPAIGLSSQLKGFERFVDLALRCAEEIGSMRPRMSDVVKEIENIMELAGFNPNSESASISANSYDDASKGHDPYSNNNLFAYSGADLPSKLEPM